MAKGKSIQLEGGRELSYLTQKDPYLGSLFARVITSINNFGLNTAVSPTGKLPPPAPVNAIQVQGTFDSNTNTITAPSELLHFTLTHNSSVRKGIQYISEISDNPDFTQPHVIDHGASRSAFVSLPSQDNDGNPNSYYLRSYPQYHGSDPAPRTTLGGPYAATKIVMTGTSRTSLLPSTGSGTASPDGQQGGKGLGTVLTRPAPRPKRSVA